MVDKSKIEQVVADTMAANADLEGIIVCDAKGKVVFGHTLAGGIKHADVAKLVVQIAASSSQLTASADKGGLKEVSIASEKGYVLIWSSSSDGHTAFIRLFHHPLPIAGNPVYHQTKSSVLFINRSVHRHIYDHRERPGGLGREGFTVWRRCIRHHFRPFDCNQF